MPDTVTVDSASVQVEEGSVGTYRVEVIPSVATGAVPPSRFVPVPHDYALHYTGTPGTDTTRVLAFGQQAVPLPLYVQNRTTGRRADLILVEDVDTLRNGAFDWGELLVVVTGSEPGSEPELRGGAWRGAWGVRLVPPDPVLDPGVADEPPSTGTIVAWNTSRPFADGDIVRFSFTPAGFDETEAADALDDVYVVPNPYVATNPFEPSIPPDRSGRGERRVYFHNLPPRATIRIYTITGELVDTVEHDAPFDDGQAAWDLTSRDGMNLAYGIYLYHVDAPGVGETVGRLAIIK
jgi:hypothetical protein